MLYPPSLRDLLLTVAALDAYDVAWSELILAEVERNVLADHPDIDQMRFVSTPLTADPVTSDLRSAAPVPQLERRRRQIRDELGHDLIG